MDAIAWDQLPNNAMQMELVIVNPILWVVNAMNVSMDLRTALLSKVSRKFTINQKNLYLFWFVLLFSYILSDQFCFILSDQPFLDFF